MDHLKGNSFNLPQITKNNVKSNNAVDYHKFSYSETYKGAKNYLNNTDNES